MGRTKRFEVHVTKSLTIYAESEAEAESMAEIITAPEMGLPVIAVVVDGPFELSDEDLADLVDLSDECTDDAVSDGFCS